MAKDKNVKVKKFIGDSGVIEKTDYIGQTMIVICIVVSFVLVLLATLALTNA